MYVVSLFLLSKINLAYHSLIFVSCREEIVAYKEDSMAARLLSTTSLVKTDVKIFTRHFRI
jgi:hypothetical protein